MAYYEVAPTKIIRSGSDVFTYHFDSDLSPGTIVTIPVGKATHVGVITKQVAKPSYPTKPISSVILPTALPAPLLDTLAWMSTYYATPLATILQTALPRGITTQRRTTQKKPSYPQRDRTHFLLTKSQDDAVATLSTSSSGTVLLHGVTGSGKTAVYVAYAKQLLSKGMSVIVIVPEIALTSQLVAEFSIDFPDLILTHSGQTEAERHKAWLTALTSEEPRLAIGPRSALFLPLKNIGAIIIDEAHEPSLKQDQSPKYSSLRVASVLAQHHNALAVQGSATPLVSEYYMAEATKRPIVTLPQRAQRHTAATVTVIDMTKHTFFSQHRFLSGQLLERIRNNLASNEQVLIFHNRRGSASTTLCEQCGWSALCTRCIVPFTLHADHHQLRCHICDAVEPVPTWCPICRSTDIIHKGIGTKLIESELHRLFPKATIARFDADSKTGETVDKRYQELYDGSIDIIIGTQVVAKGLDLPHLRTVGIVQADAGLSLPDYTSSERTYQLLAQAVGRVGRSHHATQVVVQTYQPDASAIKYGIAQNYSAFYNETLATRQKSLFPPYAYLLKLSCSYKTEATAIRNSKQLAAHLRKKYPSVTIFGPTPAFYEHQQGSYHWQIVVKSKTRTTLLSIIHTDLPKTGWQFDIDPYSLL